MLGGGDDRAAALRALPQCAAYLRATERGLGKADGGSDGRGQAALDFAFRANVLSDPSSLKAAIVALERLVAVPRWQSPAHRGSSDVDLQAAHIAAAASLAAAWLGTDLPIELRRDLLRRLEDDVFAPLIDMHKAGRFPMGRYANNWCAVVCGWSGVAAALFEGESEAAARARQVADAQIAGILEHADVSGGWAEGTWYWGYALLPILVYREVLREHGVAPAPSDFLARAGDFPLYLYLPQNSFARIGDSPGNGVSRAVLSKLAADRGRPDLQWLAERANGRAMPFEVLLQDPDLATRPPENLPPARLFSGLNWASLRSGWDDDA